MDESEITVWCLFGRKAGDNTQVRALAEELGLGYVEKQVVARPWELLCHVGRGITLAGIDRYTSSVLEAPWPDLVISAGRRNEPVARWIKEQSGGHTRLVHIGRPWAPLDTWDLVVTTPQYFLPEQDNILHNSLPLHRAAPDEIHAAGEEWSSRLADFPRPWIAVFVGGNSGQFVMTRQKGARLGSLVQHLASGVEGSLLLTDSARTPATAGEALLTQLRGPHYAYRWNSGGENPYRGLLALADAFVVTGESMSMLGEAAETGKPVYIFDLGDGEVPWWSQAHNYRYKPLSYHFAMAFAPQRMRRDVGRIQDALVDSGRAQWLRPELVTNVESLPAPAASESASVAREELARAAQAVRRLVIQR